MGISPKEQQTMKEVLTDFLGSFDQPGVHVAIQPDGRIVVAGRSNAGRR
jgi:hypothetical protein